MKIKDNKVNSVLQFFHWAASTGRVDIMKKIINQFPHEEISTLLQTKNLPVLGYGSNYAEASVYAFIFYARATADHAETICKADNKLYNKAVDKSRGKLI